jgi:peptidoglycan/xylan/chitin deacetylase (PgdA/CDA1 family)
MIGPATLKRSVKQTTGWAAMISRPFTDSSPVAQACIFYYHRVADVGFVDPNVDDWNVTPKQFERQLATLARFGEIVPLSNLQRRLYGRPTSAKPLVCLTFDDGYSGFYSEVLPILKRYRAPAAAFVVTGSIGSAEPMPFDQWAQKNSGRVKSTAWRPLNWEELEECVASGLVTVGAHSHRHLRGSKCTPSQMADEAGEARETLQRQLGKAHSNLYAYPYGNTKLGDVSSEYISAVKAAGYALAVTTDLGLVAAANDPYCLPRLEAHMLDSPGVLKAKVKGALGPYQLTDRLRGAYRAW